MACAKTSELEKELMSLLDRQRGKAEVAELRETLGHMRAAEYSRGRVLITSYPANNSDM
jgi:hypothetical protein